MNEEDLWAAGRMGSDEKAKDFKGTIGKLIRYIGNYKYGVFAVMVCAMLVLYLLLQDLRY